MMSKGTQLPKKVRYDVKKYVMTSKCMSSLKIITSKKCHDISKRASCTSGHQKVRPNIKQRQSEMANTSPRHMPVLGNVHPIKIENFDIFFS